MINKMVLQGRLVADPEIGTTQSDVKYCRFRVAWSNKYKEKERRLFLQCTAWRSTAEFIEKYFKKGQQIVIEGTLTTESWDKDGEQKSTIQMNIDQVHFCGDKKKEDSSNDGLDEMPPLDKLPF